MAGDELTIADESRGERAQFDSDSGYLWLHGAWSGRARPGSWEFWLGHSRINSDKRGELLAAGIGSGMIEDRRREWLWDLRLRGTWLPRQSPADRTRARLESRAGAAAAPERGGIQRRSGHAVRASPEPDTRRAARSSADERGAVRVSPLAHQRAHGHRSRMARPARAESRPECSHAGRSAGRAARGRGRSQPVARVVGAVSPAGPAA